MAINVMILSLVAVIASAGVTRAASATAWVSNSNGSLKLSSFQAPVLNAANPGVDPWNFAIKEKTGKKQTVKGFGASVTDGTVTAFNKLPSTLRSQLLNDLMTTAGLNFNLMRHTIASSDLSADPAYSYDDNNNQVDLDLHSFNLGDRGNAMASMLAEMRRLQPAMTLIGSSWSAPGWMKQNHALINGDSNTNKLNHQYEDAFASYFVKYVQAYESAGAHIDAITIQNEPHNNRARMPTMVIDEAESGALIRDKIGPALRNAGLSTSIWAWDHNQNTLSYPETVVSMAGSFVPAAAWHCYDGNEPEQWASLTQFHTDFPAKEQYMTECYTQIGTTDWIHSSNFNILPLQNWASGIISWPLGSFTGGGPALSGGDSCSGCTGLVTVLPDGSGYHKEIDYYMMGQFSKFIPKGAIVLDGSGSFLYPGNNPRQGMEGVGTLNPDGTRTFVIQNRFTNDIWVQLTTESESQTWNGRVPASSVTTWVLPKPA